MTTLLFLFWAYPAPAGWVPQPSGTTARLRGLSVVDERVAWAGGAGGTVLRTVDGGKTWQRRVVPDAEALDFRDIEAFDESTAYALSIGAGELSRIYKTTDGGATWRCGTSTVTRRASSTPWRSGTHSTGWPWATRWAGGS